MEIKVEIDKAGQPRWCLYASNQEVLASSSETFASYGNANRAAELFKHLARGCVYDICVVDGARYRWRAKMSNGQTIASSRAVFAERAHAERAAEAVRVHAAAARGPM